MDRPLNISAMGGLSMPRARMGSHRYWMTEASSSVRASFIASISFGLALGIASSFWISGALTHHAPLPQIPSRPASLPGNNGGAAQNDGTCCPSVYPFPLSVVDSPRSVPLLQPRHHVAQLLAHPLDGMLRVLAAQRQEAGTPGLVLQDPLAGESAGADVGQHLLHGLAHGGVDDLGA